MITMLQTTSRSAPPPRSAGTRQSMEPRAETAPETETATKPMATPSLESPRLAELMNREEVAEREKREQEALALLGRLAVFD